MSYVLAHLILTLVTWFSIASGIVFLLIMAAVVVGFIGCAIVTVVAHLMGKTL